MSRHPQPAGTRGSLQWIQRAIDERWPDLVEPILARVPNGHGVQWRSPLASDDFAVYRDADFMDRLGLAHLAASLKDFWPARGPQWDALGVTDSGAVLLVEAKAHVDEMCSPATAATGGSRHLIATRLNELAEELGARPARASWTDHFYQFCNRLAHLAFLRRHGVEAYLVLVNFLDDQDMKGPRRRRNGARLRRLQCMCSGCRSATA